MSNNKEKALENIQKDPSLNLYQCEAFLYCPEEDPTTPIESDYIYIAAQDKGEAECEADDFADIHFPTSDDDHWAIENVEMVNDLIPSLTVNGNDPFDPEERARIMKYAQKGKLSKDTMAFINKKDEDGKLLYSNPVLKPLLHIYEHENEDDMRITQYGMTNLVGRLDNEDRPVFDKDIEIQDLTRIQACKYSEEKSASFSERDKFLADNVLIGDSLYQYKDSSNMAFLLKFDRNMDPVFKTIEHLELALRVASFDFVFHQGRDASDLFFKRYNNGDMILNYEQMEVLESMTICNYPPECIKKVFDDFRNDASIDDALEYISELDAEFIKERLIDEGYAPEDIKDDLVQNIIDRLDRDEVVMRSETWDITEALNEECELFGLDKPECGLY